MKTQTSGVVVFSITRKPRKFKRRGIAGAFKGADGRWHTYLNHGIPTSHNGTLDDSVCKRCGCGYSHVLIERVELCFECRIEDIALHAIYWQELVGIDLGWRMPGDYNAEDWRAWINYRDKPTSQINQRRGERRLRVQSDRTINCGLT